MDIHNFDTERIGQDIYKAIETLDLQGLQRILQARVSIASGIATNTNTNTNGIRNEFNTNSRVIDVININDLNINRREYGEVRALHIAAKYGAREIALYLLRKLNAHVDVLDRLGKTPLLVTALEGNVDMFKLFLNHGANLYAADSEGWTAMHWATYCNKQEMLSYLLDIGMSVNVTNNPGNTPFHFACRDFTPPHLLQRMIDMGADVNHRISYGDSPLHLASEAAASRSRAQVHAQIIQVLINAGGRINDRNRNGQTPLHLCRTVLCAKLLLQHGAKLLARDNIGNLPSEWNVAYRQQVVDYLKLVQAFRSVRDRWLPLLYVDDSVNNNHSTLTSTCNTSLMANDDAKHDRSHHASSSAIQALLPKAVHQMLRTPSSPGLSATFSCLLTMSPKLPTLPTENSK